jgi:hypothetical protein
MKRTVSASVFVAPARDETEPRTIGQTAAAETRKGRRDTRQWDEPSLLRELEASHGQAEAQVAHELIEWTGIQRLRP